MGGFHVNDIARDRPDRAGAVVLDVYSIVDTTYAVYRTADRVMIQFADDADLGSQQRKALTDIYVIRGQINSLLDELREASKWWRRFNGARFERLLADALVVALQGQVQQAQANLETLLEALKMERNARFRLVYLGLATISAAAMIAFVAVISFAPFTGQPGGDARLLWFAAGVGMVGAFTSIAFAIRNRELNTQNALLDMAADAVLRIFVGGISAALLITVIKIGAVGLTLGSATISNNPPLTLDGDRWLTVLLVAFVAGLLERLVPDMLAKVTATADLRSAPAAPAATSARHERDPLGLAGTAAATGPAPVPADAAATGEDEHDDTCCDANEAAGAVTTDHELPEALGGVEPEPTPK